MVVTPIDAFDDVLDVPTTAAVLHDRLWVVNSQLDHFVELLGNDDPPQLPFEIIGIPREWL